ncbi:MAG: sigma-70 family RNA polymerase sigma factor [Pyrinomonadaceae bacterium]
MKNSSGGIRTGGSHHLKKDWTLTQQAFDTLLSRLDDDRTRAGEKYEVIRSKLEKFFEWRGCFSAGDLADETINRVARRLDEGEDIQNLHSYFYGVARLLFMETLKEQEKARLAVDHLPTSEQVSIEDEVKEVRIKCFERCLSEMPDETRRMIVEYYQDDRGAKIERRKEIAERMRIPLNALRIRAHRIRAKLEACVSNCMGSYQFG